MENMIKAVMERLDRIEAKLDYLLDCVEQTEQECDDIDLAPYGRERGANETL